MSGASQPQAAGETDSVTDDFARYTRRMCDTAALGLQAVLMIDGGAFRRTVRLAREPLTTSAEELDRILAVLALVLGRLSNVQQLPLAVVIEQLAALAEGCPV
jgi:hypothetical protein